MSKLNNSAQTPSGGIVNSFCKSAPDAAYKVGTGMAMGFVLGGPPGAIYGGTAAAGLHLLGEAAKATSSAMGFNEHQSKVNGSAAEGMVGIALGYHATGSALAVASGYLGSVSAKMVSDNVLPPESTNAYVKAGADFALCASAGALGTKAGLALSGGLPGADAAPMSTAAQDQHSNSTALPTEAPIAAQMEPTGAPVVFNSRDGRCLNDQGRTVRTPSIGRQNTNNPVVTPGIIPEGSSHSLDLVWESLFTTFSGNEQTATRADQPDFTITHEGRSCTFNELKPHLIKCLNFRPESEQRYTVNSRAELEAAFNAACPAPTTAPTVATTSGPPTLRPCDHPNDLQHIASESYVENLASISAPSSQFRGAPHQFDPDGVISFQRGDNSRIIPMQFFLAQLPESKRCGDPNTFTYDRLEPADFINAYNAAVALNPPAPSTAPPGGFTGEPVCGSTRSPFYFDNPSDSSLRELIWHNGGIFDGDTNRVYGRANNTAIADNGRAVTWEQLAQFLPEDKRCDDAAGRILFRGLTEADLRSAYSRASAEFSRPYCPFANNGPFHSEATESIEGAKALFDRFEGEPSGFHLLTKITDGSLSANWERVADFLPQDKRCYGDTRLFEGVSSDELESAFKEATSRQRELLDVADGDNRFITDRPLTTGQRAALGITVASIPIGGAAFVAGGIAYKKHFDNKKMYEVESTQHLKQLARSHAVKLHNSTNPYQPSEIVAGTAVETIKLSRHLDGSYTQTFTQATALDTPTVKKGVVWVDVQVDGEKNPRRVKLENVRIALLDDLESDETKTSTL